MTSLTRLVGSHASLIGMASYLVLSGPSAAFAASSASVPTSLSVTVNPTITLTKTDDPAALSLSSGARARTGTTSAEIGEWTIVSSNNTGYNISIQGVAGGCGTILCSAANTIAQGTPTFTGANAVAETAVSAGSGLYFRSFVTNGTAFTLQNTGAFGTTDTASVATTMWGGFPTSNTQFLNRSTYSAAALTFGIGILVDLPGTQPSGTYTGSANLIAVTNA